MRRAVVVGLVLLIAGPAAPAGAAVIHVETTGSDSATCGAAVATACLTITKAIARAVKGDTVQVGAGRFGIDEPPKGGGIAITKELTFLGAQAGVDARSGRTPAGPAETVLYDSDPATKAGALLVASTVANVVIDGFTFTGSTQGAGVLVGAKVIGRDNYRIVNNIFYRNAVGIFPDVTGPRETLIEHNLFQEQGVPSTTTIAGNGNGLYASEHRDVMIRENLFVDNDQTLAIDTRTLTQGGLPGGGRDVTFTRNVSRGGDGPVFTSLHGVTISDNDIQGPGKRGLYLGGNEQEDVHVLRNTFDGFSDIGVYLRQANPNTPQNGFVELRQNTITHNGRGIVITNEGSQDRVEIQHNRIVYNAGGGLSNADPDAGVDARDNWWGCNTGPGPDPSCAGCGPDPDPTCDEVAHPGSGSTPSFTPWMTMSFTATPSVANAGDRSTLASSLDHLSDGATPAGPFFLTGEDAFASTPLGTHTPPVVSLAPEVVSASSAYQAGADDPDELRSTIDRQTLRIKILRPPDSDVVPYVVPDDDTLTPGQVVDLVERIINDGNRPAPRVRACLRLDAKFDQQTGRCQTVRRLEPGEGIYRRIRLRVPLDACAGRVTHRLRVTVSGRQARTARATGRVLAGPCGNAPCPTARTAWTLPRPPVIARIAC